MEEENDKAQTDFFNFNENIDSHKIEDSNLNDSIEIDFDKEEEETNEQNGIPSFEPSFNSFDTTKQKIPDFDFNFDNFNFQAANDSSSFSFDMNSKQSNYDKLLNLISNPCFQVNKESIISLFRQNDPTESLESLYKILLDDSS